MANEELRDAYQRPPCQEITLWGHSPLFAQWYVQNYPLHLGSDVVFLQVECGLCMHSTGLFLEDKCSFSEKYWGHQTAIYVKLAKELSSSQWDGFYKALVYTEDIEERFDEFCHPVENWADNPDDYTIVGSDPIEAE